VLTSQPKDELEAEFVEIEELDEIKPKAGRYGNQDH